MKKTIIVGVGAFMLLTVILLDTGCTTTQKVTTNPDGTTVTNIVKEVDPVRLQQAREALEPTVSSVIRRAIRNSPQHAVEIGNYARAGGQVFCKMAANNNFNPEYLVDALNKATEKLQEGVGDDIIDAKNAAIAIYKIYSNETAWKLPNSPWPKEITSLFCNAIDQALKDAGQPGVK